MTLADWPREGLDAIWPVLRQHPLGGYIFHSHDIKSPQWLRSVARELWGYYQDQGWLPPWLAVTEEGGTVQRMRPWFNPPSAMSLGRLDDLELSRETGRLVGQFLLASGVNWNFAPVVDVVTERRSHVIGTRSFGSDPALVSRHAVAWLQGHQAAGVMATAKHFPGHGMTTKDSHLEQPVVGLGEHDQTLHLEPYRHAIAAGVGAVMTAHIAYPESDPRPATLSPYWIRQVLRGELGFSGLVVTDALSMKGIADTLTSDQAAVSALTAGADVMDCGGTFERAREVFHALWAYLEQCANGEGSLSLDDVQAVRRRIAAAKATLAPPEAWPDWPQPEELNTLYSRLRPRVRRLPANEPRPVEVWASGSRPTAVEEESHTEPTVHWLEAGNADGWSETLKQVQQSSGPVVLYAENVWKHPKLVEAIQTHLESRLRSVVVLADPVDAELFPGTPAVHLYGNRELARTGLLLSSREDGDGP